MSGVQTCALLMFELDGVLWSDSALAEDEEGPRDAEYLANAEPLFIPQRAIGHIITGRAEKYRAETEAWLHRHGTQFESLTMTPWATKGGRMEARRSIGGRGAWKDRKSTRLNSSH